MLNAVFVLVDDMFPNKVFTLEFLLTDGTLINTFVDLIGLVVAEIFLTFFKPVINFVFHADRAFFKSISGGIVVIPDKVSSRLIKIIVLEIIASNVRG